MMLMFRFLLFSGFFDAVAFLSVWFPIFANAEGWENVVFMSKIVVHAKYLVWIIVRVVVLAVSTVFSF
jgi:hypothetical protein